MFLQHVRPGQSTTACTLLFFAMVFCAPASARAQTPRLPLKCQSLDILEVNLSTPIDPPPSAAPGLQLSMETVPQSNASSQAAENLRELQILGPILGSMDEIEPTPALLCTRTGITLTMVSTRSGQYTGGVHKNILKRAQIHIRVRLHHNAAFKAVWKILLSNGSELNHAQTPPYPDLAYPLVATQQLEPRP